MRSGTHLLMATLAANFEFGDLSIEGEVPGQRWYATGRSRAVIPWGRLFGDHQPFAQTGTAPERILYIVRDPRDTLDSLWRFEAPGTAPEAFLTPERIDYWYRHASEYCSRVHWIRFEDLTGDGFEDVLEGIARRFVLPRRAAAPPGFRRVEHSVGWSPGPGRPGRWRGWPPECQARIASLIPRGFLGYELRAGSSG
jgi:hypothetical protein